MAKGASASGGLMFGRHNNPQSSYMRFKSNRYFKGNPPKSDNNRSVEFKEKQR